MTLPSFDDVTQRVRLCAQEWDELRAIYAKASDGGDEHDIGKLTSRERHTLQLLVWKRDGGPKFDGDVGGIHAKGECAKTGCACGEAEKVSLFARISAGEPVSKILDDLENPPRRPAVVAKPPKPKPERDRERIEPAVARAKKIGEPQHREPAVSEKRATSTDQKRASFKGPASWRRDSEQPNPRAWYSQKSRANWSVTAGLMDRKF